MSIAEMNMPDSIRVMVAEDEPLIAWMLEDILSGMGLMVVGPFSTVAEASSCISSATPELALLDVDLADGVVYPLADTLHAQDIPIIFHTANPDKVDLKSRYEGAEVVPKPSNPKRLQIAVETARTLLKRS